MELLLPLALVLVLALIVVVIVLQWRAGKKRRAELAAYASSQGWTFLDRDDSQVARDGTPFGIGSSRKAQNVLVGEAGGRAITAFDYSYVTQSGSGENRRRQTHRYAVLVVALPADLPRLQVIEENVLHRIGGLLGAGDIELESEDFNRRFRVTADDRKFAYDVLNARTMSALLQAGDLALRIDGAELISWDGGRLTPSQLAVTLSTAALVLGGIPDFVWSDHQPIDRSPTDGRPRGSQPDESSTGGQS